MRLGKCWWQTADSKETLWWGRSLEMLYSCTQAAVVWCGYIPWKEADSIYSGEWREKEKERVRKVCRRASSSGGCAYHNGSLSRRRRHQARWCRTSRHSGSTCCQSRQWHFSLTVDTNSSLSHGLEYHNLEFNHIVRFDKFNEWRKKYNLPQQKKEHQRW